MKFIPDVPRMRLKEIQKTGQVRFVFDMDMAPNTVLTDASQEEIWKILVMSVDPGVDQKEERTKIKNFTITEYTEREMLV